MPPFALAIAMMASLTFSAGCASEPSSVVTSSSARFARLCGELRLTEAAIEYEYAWANSGLCDPNHPSPGPSSRPIFEHMKVVWSPQDLETLISWATQSSSCHLAAAAHVELARVLDRPEASPTVDLVKYCRDNRQYLMPAGDKFTRNPDPVSWVGATAGGSISVGGLRDDPLTTSRASYQRFLQLCRVGRYREAAIEYQYGLRVYRLAYAAMGVEPARAGSSEPLLGPQLQPEKLAQLVELARYTEDYPDLAPALRLCLAGHLKAPNLTLQEMVRDYDQKRGRGSDDQ